MSSLSICPVGFIVVWPIQWGCSEFYLLTAAESVGQGRQMRWKADPRSALIKHQARAVTVLSFKTSHLFTQKPRLIPVLPFSTVLCVINPPCSLGTAVPGFTVFCGSSEEDWVRFEKFSWLKKKKLTDYPCGRGSCYTLWPGGPSLGRAQAWCAWSRGRTHPVHRPCSGAWTLPVWRFWSSGGTGWCPGPAPSSLAEPPLSQNLRTKQ